MVRSLRGQPLEVADLERKLIASEDLEVTYKSNTGDEQILRFTQVNPANKDWKCLYHCFARAYYGNKTPTPAKLKSILARLQDLYAHVQDIDNHPDNAARRARLEMYHDMQEESAANAKHATNTTVMDLDGQLQTGDWGTLDMVQLLADSFDVEMIVYTPSEVEEGRADLDLPTAGVWTIQARGSHHPPRRQIHLACYLGAVHWTWLNPKWSIADPSAINLDDPVMHRDGISEAALRTPTFQHIIPPPIARLPEGHKAYADRSLVVKDKFHLPDTDPIQEQSDSGRTGRDAEKTQDESAKALDEPKQPANVEKGGKTKKINANAIAKKADKTKKTVKDTVAVAEKVDKTKKKTVTTKDNANAKSTSDDSDEQHESTDEADQAIQTGTHATRSKTNRSKSSEVDTAVPDEPADVLPLASNEIRIRHGRNTQNPGLRFELLEVDNNQSHGLYRAFSRVYYGSESEWVMVRSRVLRLWNAVMNPNRLNNLARQARKDLYAALRLTNPELEASIQGTLEGGSSLAQLIADAYGVSLYVHVPSSVRKRSYDLIWRGEAPDEFRVPQKYHLRLSKDPTKWDGLSPRYLEPEESQWAKDPLEFYEAPDRNQQPFPGVEVPTPLARLHYSENDSEAWQEGIVDDRALLENASVHYNNSSDHNSPTRSSLDALVGRWIRAVKAGRATSPERRQHARLQIISDLMPPSLGQVDGDLIPALPAPVAVTSASAPAASPAGPPVTPPSASPVVNPATSPVAAVPAPATPKLSKADETKGTKRGRDEDSTSEESRPKRARRGASTAAPSPKAGPKPKAQAQKANKKVSPPQASRKRLLTEKEKEKEKPKEADEERAGKVKGSKKRGRDEDSTSEEHRPKRKRQDVASDAPSGTQKTASPPRAPRKKLQTTKQKQAEEEKAAKAKAKATSERGRGVSVGVPSAVTTRGQAAEAARGVGKAAEGKKQGKKPAPKRASPKPVSPKRASPRRAREGAQGGRQGRGGRGGGQRGGRGGAQGGAAAGEAKTAGSTAMSPKTRRAKEKAAREKKRNDDYEKVKTGWNRDWV